MLDFGELNELSKRFQEGVSVLKTLADCFRGWAEYYRLDFRTGNADEETGELTFRFLEWKLYARIKVFSYLDDDRKITEGQLLFGRYGVTDRKEDPKAVYRFAKNEITYSVQGNVQLFNLRRRDPDEFFTAMLSDLLGSELLVQRPTDA